MEMCTAWGAKDHFLCVLFSFSNSVILPVATSTENTISRTLIIAEKSNRVREAGSLAPIIKEKIESKSRKYPRKETNLHDS